MNYKTPLDLVRDQAPEQPVACRRSDRLTNAASWFQEHFPGEILYAVKANPSGWVLDTLYDAGIRWFDVASIDEIERVHSRFKDVTLAFLHPIKPRKAITRAYNEFGLRIFVLDCVAELEKILEATNFAKDLKLIVRIAVSNNGATLPLAGKFGASAEEAPELLRMARRYADELGVSFHVGSQCMSPFAYRAAMEHVSHAIVAAGVTVDIVDVGGGFPMAYPGITPPPLEAYVEVIDRVFEDMPVLYNADLWCEPGRALVAEGVSILAKVEQVKGESVYLNDGAFGNLFDATHCKWPFPVRVHRASGGLSENVTNFTLYGPTCDSMDKLDGKFPLPGDLREGDYIEFGMLGAYGTALQTRFNGFGETVNADVEDMPWVSVFDTVHEVDEGTVISFPRRKRSKSRRG